MSALGSLFTEDFTSLLCIDLYETDGLLLFSSKSIIFQTTDLERVIEKAENIFNFYLDFNWEIRFMCGILPIKYWQNQVRVGKNRYKSLLKMLNDIFSV